MNWSRMINGWIPEQAWFAVRHPVLFGCADPELCGEIANMVVAWLKDYGFKCEADKRQYGNTQQKDYDDNGNGCSGLFQVHQCDIGTLARYCSVVFPCSDDFLVHCENTYAKKDQDQSDAIALTLVHSVQSTVELRGKHLVSDRQAQERRNGERTHCRREHQ